MNREILFRAWHKQKKIMCDVLLICFVNRYVDVLPEDQLEGGTQEEWKFDEIELMQYTGLLDKEGNKIFEGDIVAFSCRRYYMGRDKSLQTIRFKSVVAYDEGCFTISETQDNDTSLAAFNEVCEVIGNIFDHPHLLNKTSNQ